MIVDTMTWDEILKEVMADVAESNIRQRFFAIVGSKENVYKRVALRNEQMTIFKEISILSNRKNRFYLVPFSEGKVLYKREGLCFITALFIHTKEGYYALMLTEGPIKLMAFNAHLFHRHKERCDEVDEDTELSGNMIRYALEFMCRNPWVEGKIVPNKKYGEHSLMANTTEGVLLGLEHGEVAVYKTYLSDDLLREDQTEINESLKNIRDLHELQTERRFHPADLVACSDVAEF